MDKYLVDFFWKFWVILFTVTDHLSNSKLLSSGLDKEYIMVSYSTNLKLTMDLNLPKV